MATKIDQALNLIIILALAFGVSACDRNGTPARLDAAATVAVTPSAEETQRFAKWLEEQWEAEVARSPEQQTNLGRRTNYDQWDDPSDARAVEDQALRMLSLGAMRDQFRFTGLSDDAKLSWRLYEYRIQQSAKSFPFRNHQYRFHQFRGPHSSMPAFLINQHQVATVAEAEAYIRRLEAVDRIMAAHREVAEAQVAAGVQPPRWTYPQMIATSRNVITGAPFTAGEEPSALYADFMSKIDALGLPPAERTRLINAAEEALTSSVKPAYEAIIDMLARHEQVATDDDGAWKLPDGEAFYAARLQDMTTTELSADAIHELGLNEVARIRSEMDTIRAAVGFEGSLNDFMTYMRTDPDKRFTLADDDTGREKYLAEATARIDAMRARLDELFLRKPAAGLVVKRVEPFREKSAGKAFYQRPAPDGSRPGVYYANLATMADMPTYQLEALAYHEGIPGHHMQIAIAQELTDLPSFRRFGGFTAFSEGWGLYSEALGKEIGFYEDPYSDFGRLAMELWRAARLVVDTGLHHKRWTRAEAIAYLVENTPNPEGDAVKAIERYIVMPGQATAYKIGMLKMQELRRRAETALGDRFDIREFHDVLIGGGALPLAILEEEVDRWIAAQAAA